jgi:WD40 repeat protein
MSKHVVVVILPAFLVLGLNSGCQKPAETEKQPTLPESPVPGPSPQESAMSRPPGPSAGMMSVAFSPDGKYLLVGYKVFRGKDGYRRKGPLPFLRVIEVPTGNEVMTILQHQDSLSIQCLGFLSDSRRAVAVASDGKVILVDVPSKKTIWEEAGEVPRMAALTTDGTHLVIEGTRRVRVWDMSRERPRAVIDDEIAADAPQFSHLGLLFDRKSIIAWQGEGRQKRTLCLWDISAKKSVYEFTPADDLPMAVSPDGKYVLFFKHVIGVEEKEHTFRVWDVSKKDWTPGDKWTWPVCTEEVVGADRPARVLFWDVASGKPRESVEIQPPDRQDAGK